VSELSFAASRILGEPSIKILQQVRSREDSGDDDVSYPERSSSISVDLDADAIGRSTCAHCSCTLKHSSPVREYVNRKTLRVSTTTSQILHLLLHLNFFLRSLGNNLHCDLVINFIYSLYSNLGIKHVYSIITKIMNLYL